MDGNLPVGPAPFNLIDLAAIHNGRGYLAILLSPMAYSQTEDRRIFDTARQSFRFTS